MMPWPQPPVLGFLPFFLAPTIEADILTLAFMNYVLILTLIYINSIRIMAVATSF